MSAHAAIAAGVALAAEAESGAVGDIRGDDGAQGHFAVQLLCAGATPALAFDDGFLGFQAGAAAAGADFHAFRPESFACSAFGLAAADKQRAGDVAAALGGRRGRLRRNDYALAAFRAARS